MNSNSDSSIKIGLWTEQENLLYVIFLDFHKTMMKSKIKIKKYYAFDQMSKFISTRTSLQCRSHHQKFIKKFVLIQNIIKILRSEMGDKTYKKQYKKQITQREISQNIFKPSEIKQQKQIVNENNNMMVPQVTDQQFQCYQIPEWFYYPQSFQYRPIIMMNYPFLS